MEDDCRGTCKWHGHGNSHTVLEYIFEDNRDESFVVVSKTDMKQTVFHRNVSALISRHRWQCCGAANPVQLHLRAVVCNQCAIHALPRLL